MKNGAIFIKSTGLNISLNAEKEIRIIPIITGEYLVYLPVIFFILSRALIIHTEVLTSALKK